MLTRCQVLSAAYGLRGFDVVVVVVVVVVDVVVVCAHAMQVL